MKPPSPLEFECQLSNAWVKKVLRKTVNIICYARSREMNENLHCKGVSLAHLVRGGCTTQPPWFLFFRKTNIDVGGSPTTFLSKKNKFIFTTSHLVADLKQKCINTCKLTEEHIKLSNLEVQLLICSCAYLYWWNFCHRGKEISTQIRKHRALQ